MRLTQVMLAKGFGGGERWFVDLSLALAEAGHSVQAICHKRFTAAAMLSRHEAIEVVQVDVRGWWDLIARWRIEKAIAGFRPDVPHAHFARGAYLVGRVGKRLRKPVVVTTHNYVDLSYYRDIDLFVTTTADQRAYLLANGIVADRVTTIPHFTLLQPTGSAVRHVRETATLLSFGRMVKKKGFDVLLRAFAALLRSGVAARLIIGGDGEERQALAALAAELDISEQVSFSGWIDDVGAALAEADIFVLPSLDEPFGIVVLEAMAAGVPIVATRTRGPVEILSDHTAYFAEIGDVETLALAMRQAVGDREARTARANHALARFRTHYTSGAVLPQYEDAYRRALALVPPQGAG